MTRYVVVNIERCNTQVIKVNEPFLLEWVLDKYSKDYGIPKKWLSGTVVDRLLDMTDHNFNGYDTDLSVGDKVRNNKGIGVNSKAVGIVEYINGWNEFYVQFSGGPRRGPYQRHELTKIKEVKNVSCT